MQVWEGKQLHSNPRTRPYYARRCKKGIPANIESLPEELLFEILLHLPADFLYDRARLVCRSWCRIIRSEAFARAQVRRSTYGLLLSSLPHWHSHPIYVTASRGRVESLETSELSYKCRTRIMASCNGLALELLHDDGAISLHVINPATKQPFILPSVCTHSKRVHKDRCGIGYSAASMEYKVFVPYLLVNDLPYHQRVGLHVLTVGVDKSWRNVQIHHLPQHVMSLFFQSPLSTEGFVHWGKWRYALTLNVDTEIVTMTEAPLPCQPCHNGFYYLSTGRYLSILVSRRKFSWEIWEMEPETGEWRNLLHNIELGAQKSRFQQFGSPGNDNPLPLGWVKYLEVLAFHFRDLGHTCVFYNLDTREINAIELPGPSIGFKASVHHNNLVQFKARVSQLEDM